MAEEARLAERAKRNGGANGTGDRRLGGRLPSLGAFRRAGRGVGRAGAGVAGAGMDAVGSLGGRLARDVQNRLTADLDDRDPDHLRAQLPLLWLIASLWFRGEV